MKLHLPGSSLGLDAFAGFCRYPAARFKPAPLLVWIGGAIGSEEYERRRNEEPRAVVSELERARERSGNPNLDVLLLSSPPTLIEVEGRLESFQRFFENELLPLLPEPAPSTLGVVGNSFGAHLGLALACRRAEAGAVATVAGVGLWAAVAACGDGLRADLAVRCFVNHDDFARSCAAELARELARRGRRLEVIERPGDHAFADYATNGAVTEAFAFVIDRITPSPRR